MNSLITILFTFVTLVHFADYSSTSVEIDRILLEMKNADSKSFYTSITSLKKFPYTQFSTQHKTTLQSFLLEETPHLDKVIELCGFLMMKEELRAFAQKEKLNKDLQETIRFALVRAGDKELLDTMMENLKKVPLTDAYAYNLVPRLVYTRKKQVFDLLIEHLFSNEKNCHHPDMDTDVMFSCAYPILEAIAPYIKDFPVQVNAFGIVSANPKQELMIARKWLNENKDTYELITSTY